MNYKIILLNKKLSKKLIFWNNLDINLMRGDFPRSVR